MVDPRHVDLPLLDKPHFSYAPSQVPPPLQELHDIFQTADAYVCITPEYNHAPSPALLNLLNHFGSSVFSFKPSAIVSYSAGQWGGTRAAQGLRPILSELGCLPVSAMVHVPHAGRVLDEHGAILQSGGIARDDDDKDADEEDRWRSYVSRCMGQLEWWGAAAKEHRKRVDPYAVSPAFQRDPSQRNAP